MRVTCAYVSIVRGRVHVVKIVRTRPTDGVTTEILPFPGMMAVAKLCGFQ